MAILLFIPMLSPISALTLTTTSPEENGVYPSSINIPLEYSVTADNNGTCFYDLNGARQSLASCGNSKFDVDYDGNYNLTIYAYNGTDSAFHEIDFSVDRTTEFPEAKPFLAGIIILAMIGLSFLFITIGKNIQEEGSSVIKTMLAFASVLSGLTSLYLCLLAAREYLKFESFENILQVFTTGLMYIIIFSAFMLLLFMIIQYLKPLTARNKNWK